MVGQRAIEQDLLDATKATLWACFGDTLPDVMREVLQEWAGGDDEELAAIGKEALGILDGQEKDTW